MLAESQILHSKLRKGDCRAENAKKREEGYVREKTGKKGKASSFLMSITLDFCVLLFFGWQRVLGEMFSFFSALFYLEGLALWWVPQMQKMRTAENENFTSPLLRIRLCRLLLLSLR